MTCCLFAKAKGNGDFHVTIVCDIRGSAIGHDDMLAD